MIKFENTEVVGWEAAIRGMRNPMNSWEKSDSLWTTVPLDDNGHITVQKVGDYKEYQVGPNDLELMKKLRNAGTDHRKFMRMIVAYVDITAPLYWWKEFDTYKVGTVVNSCSTMHKIAEKRFEREDFSIEHLENCAYPKEGPNLNGETHWMVTMDNIISSMNVARQLYLDTGDKKYWWQMIQLLPSSYNQKRTVMLSYEVMANIYKSRKNHKLDEWSLSECGEYPVHPSFCDWIKLLPCSDLITGDEDEMFMAFANGKPVFGLDLSNGSNLSSNGIKLYKKN